MPFQGFELPDELTLLRDTVRAFVQREVVAAERSLRWDEVTLREEQVRELQGKARAAGLWCFEVPQEYGGGGLNTFEHSVVLEEAVQHRTGLFEAAGGAFGRTPPNVLLAGAQEQVRRYVIPSVAEARRWFVAITEPSGGSDPARAIQTRAVRDGDDWVLNGRKLFSTGADRAQHGIVYARTDVGKGREGISAFIIDSGTPGMEVRPVHVIRDRWTTEITFDDCRVPAEQMLGAPGQGFALAQKWLVHGRVSIAAQSIGVASKALAMATEYAKQRETFGAPLATRQAVQWMLADSAVELRASRWLTWDAAWRDVEGREARYHASMAKLLATEASYRVVDRSIQVHGGVGLTREMPLEGWLRALRVWLVGEGPSEVHRMVIARDLLSGNVPA